MIGLHFGRWEVLAFSGNRMHEHSQATRMYACRCDCGQVGNVAGTVLRRGLSQSCGCLRRETEMLKNHAHKHAASGGTWGPCALAVALGYPG